MLGMGGTAQMARAEQQGSFMAALNGVFGGKWCLCPAVSSCETKTGEFWGPQVSPETRRKTMPLLQLQALRRPGSSPRPSVKDRVASGTLNYRAERLV